MRIKKRDGSLEQYSSRKITRAILMAANEVDERIDTRRVHDKMSLESESIVTVDEIQDAVLNALRECDYTKVADAYAVYRLERDERRRERLTPDSSILGDYIVASKYARWLPEKKRRETWDEIVDRTRDMHTRKYPELKDTIAVAFEHVRARRVLPSMRSLQFGGRGVEQHNVRLYNCSYSLANRLRVFQETFYNLLCGCGCGLSVQFEHIEQLPEVKRIDRSRVRHFTIPDTIEGWADSVGELVKSYFVTGEYVEFNYSKIRDRGERLSTSGGLAPGHLPLRHLHEQLREQLDECSYRKLRPVEVFDIICKIAESVLAGGIRRSSLIILFSPYDSEMAHSKSPGNFEWEGRNFWRRMANISASCDRNMMRREDVDRLIRLSRAYGEPGVYWNTNINHGCNPCGEIGMDPVFTSGSTLQVDESLNFHYKNYGPWFLRADGTWTLAYKWMGETLTYAEHSVNPIECYGHNTGWQFCNLCEVNVAACTNEHDFLLACSAAAFIGTLQASYNEMPYLGPVTEAIVRRDALLGVSLTGVADSPHITYDTMREGAEMVKKENEMWAKRIGINPGTRLTTVKPSGTASLVLGSVGSGIHPHHARRYFRRVTETPDSPVAQFFEQLNPHMVETKPDGNKCITFCVKAPDNAMTVKNTPAVDFMKHVFEVYEAWVRPGTRKGDLTHNVSCTVVVGDDEWNDVIEMFWKNRKRIAAMAFLPRMGDKGIPFMPREEVVNDVDETRWDYLIQHQVAVPWDMMREESDGTTVAMACEGLVCETPSEGVQVPVTD